MTGHDVAGGTRTRTAHLPCSGILLCGVDVRGCPPRRSERLVGSGIRVLENVTRPTRRMQCWPHSQPETPPCLEAMILLCSLHARTVGLQCSYLGGPIMAVQIRP